MTSTELKALQDSLLADNNQGQITPQDLRDVTTELIKKIGGWADYNNSVSTLQSLPINTWTKLNNDGLGSFTDETYLPFYSTSLFSNNEVQLDGLPLGSVVTIRFDISLNVLSANTDVQFRINAKNNLGNTIYTSLFDYKAFKNVGSLSGVEFYTFHIGSEILEGSIALELKTDKVLGALFLGVFITIP